MSSLFAKTTEIAKKEQICRQTVRNLRKDEGYIKKLNRKGTKAKLFLQFRDNICLQRMICRT